MATETEVMQVIAELTATTCAEGCWYAREQVCRCSCGGENHGVLLKNGAERPKRTRKVNHARYELHAVVDAWGKATAIARDLHEELTGEPYRGWRDFTLRPSWGGPPEVGVEEASISQAKWSEIQGIAPAWSARALEIKQVNNRETRPGLVWRRIDPVIERVDGGDAS